MTKNLPFEFRAKQIFDYISIFKDKFDKSPTLDEIANAVGLEKTQVNKIVTQLCKEGYLKKERYTQRGIRILKKYEG